MEPLHEIKANLFRALAHPVPIRVLELLVAAETDHVVRRLAGQPVPRRHR